ncbi:MAG: type I secretion system permease/ATPase [Janthinobacterium lividum]
MPSDIPKGPFPLKPEQKKEETLKFSTRFPQEEWQQKISSDDSILACLEFLASYHGKPTSAVALKAGLPLDQHGLNPTLFVRAAERIGLSAKILHKKLEDISPFLMPCVLILDGTKSCLLVSQPTSEDLEVIFPETGQGSKIINIKDLNQIYSGYAIFTQTTYQREAQGIDVNLEKPKDWFWGTLWKSWPIYIQVAVSAIFVNLFALASPLFVMNVYDRVVPNNAIETLWVLTTGILIVFSFDLLLKMLRVYYVDTAGQKADVILAGRLFEHVLGMRLANRPKSSGGFANQLREFENLREFFSSATLVAFIDLPFVFLFILIVAAIGGEIAWVPLLSVPLVIVVTLVLQGPLKSWVNRSFKEGALKHSLLVEAIHGLETIKSFSAEGRIQRNWENFVSQSAASSNKVKFLAALALNFTGFIQQASYVICVIVGVYLINRGELSTGGLIACTILAARAMAPLSQVVSLLTKLNQSKSTLETLNKVIELPSERNEGQSYLHRPSLAGDIEFREVNFTYPGQKVKALNNLNLTIKAKEKIGIVGRIGSGKSTIEKLILNLYSPEGGTVSIDSTDIRQIDPADLRSNIGYVPQDVYLFGGSVRENITFGSDMATDEEVLKASIMSGSHDFIRL